MFNILVVEDDKNLRKLITTYLKKNNYTPFEANDGEEALDMLDKHYINLIISDVMMPKIDGFQLIKELRMSQYKLPILLITARDSINDKKEGFLSGADDYMVKPINLEELLLRVKVLLKRSDSVNERIIEIGDFVLNYDQMSATKLVDNFNKMVKDLGSIECLQKEFIDNVSHEIKTPISSIQGFAELLKDDNLTKEEREEYTNIIIEESNRLLNLSTNMLKLSKLQNQNKIVKKDQVDIAEQIRKAITLLEPKWSKKEITFNVSLQEKYFFGDEELIFQVWVNLIENAIKYSNENSKIDVTMSSNDKDIRVQIRDYGRGMNKKNTKKIFSRFYQIDKSHSQEGNGLGLAIVKRIIELSNGKIEVDSEENVGTIITVILPVEKETNKILIK